MFDEDGFGDYGANAAATCKSGDGREEMDEKDHEIRAFRILTTKRKLAEFLANWQFAMDKRYLSAVKAVAAYKELNEVERAFCHLKDLLELLPVYHQRDTRVQAHVFVAALGLLLDRALEKSLRAAGSSLSTAFVWQALETIRCVEIDLGQSQKTCVTRCSKQAAEVLRALGITQPDPPSPPEGRRWLV